MNKKTETTQTAGSSNKLSIGKLAPAVILVVGLIAFFAFDFDRYLTFESLRENRAWLIERVHAHAILMFLGFGAIYAVSTAFSLPTGAFMTVTSGFLFGQWQGTACVVIFATAGATVLFIAAKWGFSDYLRARVGPLLQKVEKGFSENQFSYLLTLRLIPLFPFWFVNLVPAFLGVRLRTYVTATAIGIFPGSFVYVSIGVGLGSIFDSGQEFTLKGAVTPEIIVALCGLAVLSLLPVAYKKIKAKR